MSTNAGKYRDRTPHIKAAGKTIAVEGNAKECLCSTSFGRETPDVVKKFQGTKSLLRPEPGQERKIHARAGDSNVAAEIRHGVNTKTSNYAGDLTNPKPQTLFNQVKKDRKEAIYASKQRAPLGKSHDQRPGLPSGFDPNSASFGLQTVRDGTAAEMVSPSKSRDEVDQAGREGHELYVRSHGSYEAGEIADRDYDWSHFTKESLYGVPTPHNNDGIHVRSTLKWMHEAETEKAAKLVSKRVDDFREKSQPQLGKVHDPIKDTMHVPDGHSFGVMVRPDPYGAGDLIHNRTPKNYLRGKDSDRGMVAAIRQHLKKENFQNFNDLQAAFQHYDKDGSSKINANDLRQVCFQYNVPVDDDMLKLLIEWCDLNQDGQINYTEFANFLNWHHNLPTEEEMSEKAKQAEKSGEKSLMSPGRLTRQIDENPGGYKTSAQMINAVVGGVSTKDYHTHGVATIRSDLPAPRIRRVSDHTNYGDESDARGLVNPNVYANIGVYEQDFFQARSQEQVQSIIEAMGVEMTPDVFQELWERAARNDANGLVSIESFRAAMEESQSTHKIPLTLA